MSSEQASPLASLRLALWQGRSPGGDVEAAFAVVERVLAAAAAAGAAMAVFPELFLPGYNSARVSALAEPLDGPWCARLAQMARAAGCGLTIGFAERDGARVYNAAVAIDASGARLASYRKVQLYGPRERALFWPGDRLVTFDWAGRRAALLICYDIEFAPHLRTLAERGVGLILCPTANMRPFEHVARLTVPSQAVNHAVTIVYANYCGEEGDLVYCGGSLIAGPDGVALASAGRGEALLVVDLGVVAEIAGELISSQLADLRRLE